MTATVNQEIGGSAISGQGTGAVESVNGQTGVVELTAGDVGAGDVTGPASSTDNAVVRYDGTTGKLVQNSAVTIADTTGDITGGKYNTVAISGASTPTLAVTGTTAVSGTNTGDQNLFSTIAVSGQSDVVADSTSDILTLEAGAGITLTTNATTDKVTIAATAAGGFTVVAPVSVGTSTTKDITGIPAGVKVVVISLKRVSTNGTSLQLLQLGTSGGIDATNYQSVATGFVNSATAGTVVGGRSTAGFLIYSGNATNEVSGDIYLTLTDEANDIWNCLYTLSSYTGNGTLGISFMGSGEVDLGGDLSQFRLTTVGGSDVFDGSGTVGYKYSS